MTAAWEAALRAPEWDRDPVWVHGDIARGNLLVHDGRIHAVIDFGCIGVGDPACDLLIAWDLFDRATRPALPGRVAVDDADLGIGGAAGRCAPRSGRSRTTCTRTPSMVAQARHKLAEVLAETT